MVIVDIHLSIQWLIIAATCMCFDRPPPTPFTTSDTIRCCEPSGTLLPCLSLLHPPPPPPVVRVVVAADDDDNGRKRRR